MNKDRILTYGIDEQTENTTYYSMPENTTDTEIHVIFKGDEQDINKMQYAANSLSSGEKKATIVLSPVTKATITDVIQNYQKEKLDAVVSRLNMSIGKIMAELKRRGIKFDNCVDILAETEEEQKFSDWLKTQYPQYYEYHAVALNNAMAENNAVGGGPSYQGNSMEQTKSNVKTLKLVPPKPKKNSGFVSWYGIVFTLIFALGLGYSIAYVIWNYLK